MIGLPESIETINQRLIDLYGLFETGDANYRVVWSDDQLEKRFCDFSETGLFLLQPRVLEVKKYSYIKSKYILEKIFPVPAGGELTTKISYEPLWTFEDKNGFPLAPVWGAIEIILYSVHKAMAMAGHKPVEKEPEIEGGTKEAKEARIKMIEEELFGNETRLGDALSTDRAVGYGVRQRNDSKFD